MVGSLVADFARVIKALGGLRRPRTTASAFSNFPAHLSEAGKLPRKRRCYDDFATTPLLSAVARFCGPTPSAVTPYLSNSGAHIRRDDFERKLDVGKNSVFLPRYLVQSQLNEARKSRLRVKPTGKSIIPLRLSGNFYLNHRIEIIELFVLILIRL